VVPGGPAGAADIPTADDASSATAHRYLLAADLLGGYAKDLGYENADAAREAVERTVLGHQLADVHYDRLFDYYADEAFGTENAWRILADDYVSTSDGTGVVHQAPAYGEDDKRIGDAAGIPTICLGSALDILQAGNPPRAAFTDFPLGHTAGPPGDPEQQYRIVRDSLRALESISAPGDIRPLDVSWPDGDAWRIEAERGDSDDERSPRDMEPRYQTEQDRRLAEAMAGN